MVSEGRCLMRILWRRWLPVQRGPTVPTRAVSLLFEPRDLWIGVYWKIYDDNEHRVYVCLVPALPLLIQWWGPR